MEEHETDESDSGRTPGYNPPSRKSIPSFEALRAFDAVARLGGVRQAARSLGRDHAVISRHLKGLEKWTGTRLLERTPTGIALTEPGRLYHRDIANAMDMIAASTIELLRRGYHNHLHIACAPGFALHWMSRRVGMFERQNPDVAIELRPTDRNPNSSSYETDIEIRFVSSYRTEVKQAPGMRCQEVVTVPIIAVASPDYLAASSPINTPADLIHHRLLHEFDFDTWSHWLAAHGVYDEIDLTGPRLWQGHLTLDAAIHGRGITLINSLIAETFIEAGQLVEVGFGNPQFQPYADGKYLIFSRADRWETPLIRRYRRWLIDTLAQTRKAA